MRSPRWLAGADLTQRAECSVARGVSFVVFVALFTSARDAHFVHSTDGVLPWRWCVAWTATALPFVVVTLSRFELAPLQDGHAKALVAMVGAAVFAISCMFVPVPFVGTCSHRRGTGRAAVPLGPSLTVTMAEAVA